MSIFLVISFLLEQQTWFRVCVVPMVLITLRFIIQLAWCHRRLVTSSWNISTNVSWSSSTFWGLPGYQSDSWWEIPSLPRWFVLSSTTLLPSLQHKFVRVLCYTFSSLLPNIVLLYLGILPPFMSRMSWQFYHLLRILDIVISLAFCVHFLVSVLFLTGIPTNGLWCVNSKLLATLLLWSYWSTIPSLNHHSNIDRAT